MGTLHFIGSANPVKQVDTITVALTWATSDPVTIQIGGGKLTVTVGASDTTTANVATAIKDAINATSALDGTGNTDATSDVGGQSIPEFTEVTATVSGSVVTVTANTAGKPFTMSVDDSGVAGDGTATEATATAATGPSYWDNVENWSSGAVPVSTDDVIIDHRAVSDILYGLDQNSVTLTSMLITNGFTRKLGLSSVNQDNPAYKYSEYRERYLKISATTLSIRGDGVGSGRIKINLGSAASTIDVQANGSTSETNVPAVQLIGTNAANVLSVSAGNVGFCHEEDVSGHLATLRTSGTSIVTCGKGVDLANATIVQSGATSQLTIGSATGSGTISLKGGTLNVILAAHASIDIDSGILNYKSSGTLTTLTSRGRVNFSPEQTRTVTNCVVSQGAEIHDPSDTVTFTNGIDLYYCGVEDVLLSIGKHFTVTKGTI